MKYRVVSLQFLSIFFTILSYSIFFFLDKQTITFLAKEDGLIEWLGVTFFLIASFIFLINFLKNKSGNNLYLFRTKKNVFFLLLCLICFFGLGEEISWGQRIFRLRIPQILEKINTQKEVNIHNITIFEGRTAEGKVKSFLPFSLTGDRLFSLFCLIYGLLVPILARTNSTIFEWCKKINVPIVPLWTGMLFIISYTISRLLNFYVPESLRHYCVEIKETNFEFLFAIMSIYFYQIIRKKDYI